MKKLRVWYIDRLPMKKETIIEVKNVEEAKLVIKTLTERDLNDERITDNVMSFQEFDGEDWTDYTDEDGRDIDEIMEEDLTN